MTTQELQIPIVRASEHGQEAKFPIDALSLDYECFPSMEVMEAVERDGQTIVTVKVDGAFDRTGLPDPLLMDHCFTITGYKVVALTCRLAGEASEA